MYKKTSPEKNIIWVDRGHGGTACPGPQVKKTVEDTPMQSANITSTGEVLYLDADALEAKVDSSRPLRVNQSDGIGFKNWLVHRMSVMLANDKKGGCMKRLFRAF